MLTIEPLPLASMPGRNAWIVRCIDLTLRSKEKSQSALGAVEHRAVVHEARRVEQHVDRPDALGHRLDGGGVARIELHALGDARLLQAGERRLVDVAGDHPGALARERERRGPADAGARRRAERELALEPTLVMQSSPISCVPHVGARSARVSQSRDADRRREAVATAGPTRDGMTAEALARRVAGAGRGLASLAVR